MPDVLSFHVVPSAKGIEQAEQRLREMGFTQIKQSHDGRYLQVVAPKLQVERALQVALVERRQRVQVGPVTRMVTYVEMAEGATIPDSLRDIITELIFPLPPNYHGSATSMR